MIPHRHRRILLERRTTSCSTNSRAAFDPAPSPSPSLVGQPSATATSTASYAVPASSTITASARNPSFPSSCFRQDFRVKVAARARSPSLRCRPRSPTTPPTNIARVTELVREAAGAGAQIILPQRAVRGPLLLPHPARGRLRARPPRRGPPDPAPLPGNSPPSSAWSSRSRSSSRPAPSTTTRSRCSTPTAATLGVYRKSHIPDGPGYQEKFFFKPGNTGFSRVRRPGFGTIGVAICRDQWFPEARARDDARRAPTSCSTRPRLAPSPRSPSSTAATPGSA